MTVAVADLAGPGSRTTREPKVPKESTSVAGSAPPTAAETPQWRNLFNRSCFHELNIDSNLRVLSTTVLDDRGKLIGGTSGIISGDVFTSGYSAPFGGIDIVKPRPETPENVDRVVTSLLASAAAQQVRRIIIKMPPPCYDENQGLALYSLINHGFTIERCALNQHIDIGFFRTVEDWAARLRSPARRALRYLLAQDFTFSRCTSDDDVRRAYNLLADNRARKGRRLSLTSDYVCRAHTKLAPNVAMYLLRFGDTPVAASLNYLVAPGRSLVVAWGDSGDPLPKSPMVLLAYLLIELAISDGTRILDLGTSNHPVESDNSPLRVDSGLAQFKRGVLASATARITLTKEMARGIF